MEKESKLSRLRRYVKDEQCSISKGYYQMKRQTIFEIIDTVQTYWQRGPIEPSHTPLVPVEYDDTERKIWMRDGTFKRKRPDHVTKYLRGDIGYAEYFEKQYSLIENPLVIVEIPQKKAVVCNNDIFLDKQQDID